MADMSELSTDDTPIRFSCGQRLNRFEIEEWCVLQVCNFWKKTFTKWWNKWKCSEFFFSQNKSEFLEKLLMIRWYFIWMEAAFLTAFSWNFANCVNATSEKCSTHTFTRTTYFTIYMYGDMWVSAFIEPPLRLVLLLSVVLSCLSFVGYLFSHTHSSTSHCFKRTTIAFVSSSILFFSLADEYSLKKLGRNIRQIFFLSFFFW